ncbi:MAG TPA: DUF4239 domain-containing protein [Planktothrix sp.]
MLGSYWFLILMIAAAVSFAIAGALTVRRLVSHDTLVNHHDVAGYMMSIIGTLYAVVLGLIVVNSLNTFQTARSTVEQEANSLSDIFHLAAGMPNQFCSALRNDCYKYADAVVNDEWSTMQNGKPSAKVHILASRMWQTVVDFKPQTDAEADLHQSLLAEVNELSDCRHARLEVAQPEFDAIIWGVLVFGGVVVIVFTYFFGVKNVGVQMVMTILVTLALALNLTLVGMFGYPYSGDVRVSAEPFAYDLQTFKALIQEQQNGSGGARTN